jgi:hypothetical protein
MPVKKYISALLITVLLAFPLQAKKKPGKVSGNLHVAPRHRTEYERHNEFHNTEEKWRKNRERTKRREERERKWRRSNPPALPSKGVELF